ncbi:phosphatase PAP2 family protein [Krasilnikovia sp. MM14-A1259]|uniref:phosphatase PAP2 family protein n=1 Tax=Krasilnikovia sp. MM14-A1259 TaxID=3373539 RepID=UPI00399C872B
MERTAVRTRVRPVTGWWLDAALLVAFGLLTLALARGHLLSADEAVADWALAHQPVPLHWAARVLNYLGQGGQVLMPVAGLLALLLARRTRSVRPVLVCAGAFVLTYLTIGPLKVWLDRAAPKFHGPQRAVLFNAYASGKDALSYPSGHVANALVWYGVIALLAGALLRAYGRGPLSSRARAALRLLPPVIVFCTTTYLAFHWITDSVAGLLLGLILARLMARVPWDAVPLPRLPGGVDRPAGLT